MCICRIVRDMSCLRFAEMSIYFRFNEFQANSMSYFYGRSCRLFYDFDIAIYMHAWLKFFCLLYHAGNHESQWKGGGKMVAIYGACHVFK